MTRQAELKSRPISAEEAAALFSCFESFHHTLLAISGGPDSVALMILARDWAKARGRSAPKFSVATVDHGLRKEAGDEAELVARIAKKINMPHATLHWRGPKPKTGIQEKARTARYDMLIAHARMIKADAIAFAHHADDQAETILIRLAAGSGLAGLAGMKPVSHREEISILRPLLDLSSARLRATLIARNIDFVDDPSNENDLYARVRVRKARDVLVAEGLTGERLNILAHRMARADDALREMARIAEHRHALPLPKGRSFAPSLFDEPVEILIRVLNAAIVATAGEGEPMLHRLENRSLDLRMARNQKKALKLTIGGAVLSLSTDGRLKITPESPRRKV